LAEPPASAASPPPVVFAWLVHAFTASGAVLALLALVAVEQRQWTLALLWLLVALVVDGLDGSLARWAHVRERVKRIDGDALDLIVDYLTYVFVPTLFLWRAGLMPEALALPLAAAIQFSSLYLFTRTDMKTDDGYFQGFPSLWNLVAFYLFAIGASPVAGAVTIAFFVIATFAPIHFVHPFRVRDFGWWLPALAILWAVCTFALILPAETLGALRSAMLVISLASGALLIALGLLRTLRGSRPASA
jgi:phosphatidylcholine synthase